LEKLKVLILAPDLSLDGGVAHFYRVLQLHKEEGIDYFINSSNAHFVFTKILKIVVLYLKFMVKLIKIDYQIIHINPSLNPRSFYRDAVYILLARWFRKKVLIFFRGWETDFEKQIKKQQFKGWIFKQTFARADQFVILSNIFRQKLIQLGINSNKRFNLQTTIADDSFFNELNLAQKIKSFDKKITILFLSRIVKEKGIYIALDTFNLLQDAYTNPSFELIIAGDGREFYAAKNYSKENNIKNVNFIGWVSGRKKGDLFLRSHIFFLPTYYGEGLPNSILEAMLYGMPVISRENAGIGDWVKNGINGYITESKNPKDFLAFFHRLISNKDLYSKIAFNNIQIAKQHFTPEQVKQRFFSIYQELLDS
jgi:glycosyltransferase involved in cell wall biosynthesis